MNDQIINVLLSFGVLFALLFAGVQIGICLMTAGFVGLFDLTGSARAGLAAPLINAYDVASSYPLMVIPLFMALGSIAAWSGITTDLFTAFYRWFGRVHGGVAIATVGTSAGMAAVTGSSVAVASAMTKIALPELQRYGYAPGLSVGAIAMGGTLAIMIPPSITFVIFAIFAEQSIGRLLIAGLIPGVLMAAGYIIKIYIRCRLNPELGPRGPAFSHSEKVDSLKRVGPFFVIVGAIIFGMLFGVWTPNESAAGGVILVILLAWYRRRTLDLRALFAALREAAMGSAAIFLVVIGSLVFGSYIARNGIANGIAASVMELGLPDPLLFAAIIAVYFVLGCVMEVTSILALTIPLVMPIVLAVGWDPIWFGVVVVALMEIAAVTPPLGLNLFAMKAASPSTPLSTIYMGSAPYWLIQIGVIALLYLFPAIALFLPSLM